MSTWDTKSRQLPATRLQDLIPTIQKGLENNFHHSSVEITSCPDLTQPPFYLASRGLCGNERIADIGGPPNLHPRPQLDKKYSLLELTRLMEMSKEQGFILGAGAGPFHHVGTNSELAPNLSYRNGNAEVENRSYYTKIEADGSAICQPCPSTDCALLCNLFGSDGSPGDVLKITAKNRTGDLDFISSIRFALSEGFGNHPVSMGGVFIIRSGEVKLHVMPDFHGTTKPVPIKDVEEWLRFFVMRAPLVCLSVFHSYDPGLDLRMEHTHCFSKHGEGGHYHHDTTPAEVEYEAYFNVAKAIYRIDRPTPPADGVYRGL